MSNKKEKMLNKKEKNFDFSKFLFNIFSSIAKKRKNVEQFDIFLFDIFSSTRSNSQVLFLKLPDKSPVFAYFYFIY